MEGVFASLNSLLVDFKKKEKKNKQTKKRKERKEAVQGRGRSSSYKDEQL